MEDNMHALTKLMLARMASHPEEFEGQAYRFGGMPGMETRWRVPLDIIKTCGTEEEKSAIDAAFGKIHMDAGHRWAMDELTNGPERRAKVEEELKYYAQQNNAAKNLAMQQNLLVAQMSAQQNTPAAMSQQAYSSAGLYNTTTSAGNIAVSPPLSTALRIGDETLDANIPKKIKKAVGL